MLSSACICRITRHKQSNSIKGKRMKQKTQKSEPQADTPQQPAARRSQPVFLRLSGPLLKRVLAEMKEKELDKIQPIVIDALKKRYNLELV